MESSIETSINWPRPVFPLVKREENAQSGIHPRGDIGDRKTGLAGLSG